jgi:lipopolysaccharide transport system permease protein
MSVSLDKTKQVDTAATPVTVIRPPKGWIPINLRELWAYRELLYFFTWRDIKVRYKQTVLGFAWAIAFNQPGCGID